MSLPGISDVASLLPSPGDVLTSAAESLMSSKGHPPSKPGGCSSTEEVPKGSCEGGMSKEDTSAGSGEVASNGGKSTDEKTALIKAKEKLQKIDKKEFAMKYILPLFTGVVAGAVIGGLVGGLAFKSPKCSTCKRYSPLDPNPIPGIFDPLTPKEMEQIQEVLIESGTVDNLTTPLGFNSSYVASMSMYPPEKNEILNYYQNQSGFVGRFAEVHVVGSEIQILLVGPLQIEPVDVQIMSSLPLDSRNIDVVMKTELEIFIQPVMTELKPILEESFDGATYPRDLAVNFNTGFNKPGTTGREIRFSLHLRGLGEVDKDLFHMLPVSGIVAYNGSSLEDWQMKELFYLNQGPFANASDLLAAYNESRINKVHLPTGYRKTLSERLFPRSLAEKRENSEVPPPRSYSPGTPRYRINNYNVTWMGWNFAISNNPMRGLATYNVQFRGVRILYEMALQDILVRQTADTHGENNAVHLLSSSNIGEYEAVIPSVDCPERATLLSTTYWNTVLRAGTTTKSICVFEGDGEMPLWRRRGDRYASGLRDNYLVVRATSRVGNLDFAVEYRFHLDGSIDTNIHSFGTLQGAFWNSNSSNIAASDKRNAFGFNLADYVGGMSGSHSFNFKVDVDVVDTLNSFQEISWKQGTAGTALRSLKDIVESQNYFVTNATLYPSFETITEESGLVKAKRPQVWLVSSSKNASYSGYQVAIDASLIDIIQKEHPGSGMASFTKHDLAVLRRKKNEQYFTMPYDSNTMPNSVVNLDKLMDPSESTNNTDIVLSVNVGFLDMPRTEDVPVRRRQSASFHLRPFNMFPRSPDLDLLSFFHVADGSIKDMPAEFESCIEPRDRLETQFPNAN